MRKSTTCMLFFCGFIGSALGQDKTLYEEVTFNEPSRGEEGEVYLGDRMLVQQVGMWKECITPQRTYSMTTWAGVHWTYKANEPMCKQTLGSKNYMPTYETTPGRARVYPVTWREKKKGNYRLCTTDFGVPTGCIKNLTEDDVESGTSFVYSPNSFQQTIAYDGRSGDILKFNYAEFTDGFSREAFSREFQVDLTEGNVAAYKGAIIEVIDATNVQIKYKVIRNFSSGR